jgi:UDP-N-acetylglucosamine 1-carboxyvinyltransferase
MASAEQIHFEVHGGKKLHGEISIGGSKNGTVALLSAALLNKGATTLRNVPKIEEVYRLLEVLESIGMKAVWEKSTLTLIPPLQYNLETLNIESARRTRSILMFIGPLLHSLDNFLLPHSGGCKLGSRTVRPHFYALEKLGVKIQTLATHWKISKEKLTPAEIVMYESSDTATANTLMAAARIPGTTTIKYASANYQVQELCFFLEECGVTIEGIGTTTLVVHGKKTIDKPIVYTLSEDPIVTMLYLAAAVVTRSTITIKRAPIEFLEKELLTLEKMGFRYEVLKHYLSVNKRTKLVDIKTKPSVLKAPEDKIHACPYPGLNMDNLPFFAVIATQARGTTLIHDWMYEKRALYLTELDKLGGETMLADPHRIYIEGPKDLRPVELVAPPALRPAVVLLVAMLAAKGRSILRNVYPINRGYEDIVGNLRSLGADVSVLKS